MIIPMISILWKLYKKLLYNIVKEVLMTRINDKFLYNLYKQTKFIKKGTEHRFKKEPVFRS